MDHLTKRPRRRNPVAKELPKFKHKAERSYKERLQQQEESERDQEIREYKNGKEAV